MNEGDRVLWTAKFVFGCEFFDANAHFLNLPRVKFESTYDLFDWARVVGETQKLGKVFFEQVFQRSGSCFCWQLVWTELGSDLLTCVDVKRQDVSEEGTLVVAGI